MFPSREKEESLIVCNGSVTLSTEQDIGPSDRWRFFAKDGRKGRFDILCGARALHRTVCSVGLCCVFSSLASVVEFERNNNNKVFDPRTKNF